MLLIINSAKKENQLYSQKIKSISGLMFFTEDFIIPQYGVYASYSVIDGKKYPSVTNVGVRPTIEGLSKERSETNIVGFTGDLYDKNISVHLLKKIREEMKFNNLDELKNQIAKDREVSKNISKDNGVIL